MVTRDEDPGPVGKVDECAEVLEGQITRLKLIKRQMYGRANFDLLKQRVLAAA